MYALHIVQSRQEAFVIETQTYCRDRLIDVMKVPARTRVGSLDLHGAETHRDRASHRTCATPALRAATCREDRDPRLQAFTDEQGLPDWPGFAYHDGQKVSFGRAAEDNWFVQPARASSHAFWSERTRVEAAVMSVDAGRPRHSPELGFDFSAGIFPPARFTAGGVPDKVVLAVARRNALKDTATEEEKVGLLLGMWAELKLPLAGITWTWPAPRSAIRARPASTPPCR